MCHRHKDDIVNCFPVLQKRGLIGKGHVFKKYGYGYGMNSGIILYSKANYVFFSLTCFKPILFSI
jgi:hypothetical protein